jgi:N-acetyl-anhydromuramyl-L-alanine amidase AmpD
MHYRNCAAFLTAAALLLFPATAADRAPASALAAERRCIWSDEREALTREYFRVHAGESSAELVDPALIVVHYTGTDSREASLRAFDPARLSGRADIASGGDLNVGVHYLIDQEGATIALLPESKRGRHAIGFNHLSLGIELVASGEERISAAQRTACLELTLDLAERYPSIRYLIGHHEYARPDLPHAELFRELDESYRFTDKIDPGPAFMAWLRNALTERGRRFLD